MDMEIEQKLSGHELPQMDPNILDLVREERQKALSHREWTFRLRGYGFAIKDVDGDKLLTRLPRGEALGVLPAEFA